ncbi:MAG: hypothetical protein C3F13_10635 [Anaerolineales bacterium]|nr:hypothetical protein [Anaerolineae bacterium]PWB53064.1 MAG: hypothetical protein C3F13_10635 [Anaerolineales bacterium]
MSTPTLLLGLIISTLYGALFHLWRGGNAGRLLLYLLLSWVGFWVGQILGNLINLSFDIIGQLHIGMATVGSLIFLGIGYWLSLVQSEPKVR